jgi:hypothetical protein
MRLSTKDLALCLGVTSRRINQLTQAGVFPQPEGAGHDPKVAISAYVKFLQRRATAASIQEATLAKLNTETALKQIQLRRLNGELLEASEVHKSAFKIGREIRDGLLNIPDRMASLVAAESDPKKVHAMLLAEFRQVLEVLAEPSVSPSDKTS